MTVRSLRNLRHTASKVTDLKHTAIVPEVSEALLAWAKYRVGAHPPGVLIGGLALAFYCKPRYTTDVDLLFLSPQDIPADVPGFRRHRTGAFEEKRTQVEVCTPASIKLPIDVATKVFQTAVTHSGMKVASLEGLIALKLFGADSRHREYHDKADLASLLAAYPNVDMAGWNLSSSHQARLEEIRGSVAR